MSRLRRAAIALGRQGRRRKPARDLPALWLVIDPARIADPLAAVRALPRGAGVIYRAFGAADGLEVALALRRLTHRGGLTLLIGADARLASAARADGVHLPQRAMDRAIGLRRAHPLWLITSAAHDARAIRRGRRFDLDALLVSVVFESRSPSAGAALGPIRFAALIRGARTPVIALGGVNEETAPRLARTGARGLAAVEGLNASA
jgi:thiamine-phosphate pyrophosphorylase